MTGMVDLREWVDKAKGGDQVAFQELYRRCRPYVARLLDGFGTLDRDQREDIIQESFVRAFKALPRLKATSAFLPWLLSISRNRALTHVTRQQATQRVQAELESAEPVSAELVPESLRTEVDVKVVQELIASLPEGQEKETARLFYLEGELSAREIADRLGVGKSAITMRLERFRARVKRDLLARLVRARWE